MAKPRLFTSQPMNSGKDFVTREMDVASPVMASGQAQGNQGGDLVLMPPSSPEPADSTLGLNVPAGEPSPSRRSTRTPRPSSPSDGLGFLSSETSPTLRVGGRSSGAGDSYDNTPWTLIPSATSGETEPSRPSSRPNLTGETPPFGPAASRARTSASPASARDSPDRAQDSHSPSSTLWGDTDPGSSSSRTFLASLRRALADAQRDGLVTRNVAALAEAPKLTQRERTILTAEQCRTLIEGTRDDRLHALYVLAVTTGMREAEMLGLTWEDVDLGADRTVPVLSRGGPDLLDDAPRLRASETGGSVTVRHTLQRVEGEWKLMPPKTDKSRRTIPLTPVAVAALKAHRQRQMEERLAAGKPGKEGLVFTTPSGLPIHGSNLLPDFRRHLARLKGARGAPLGGEGFVRIKRREAVAIAPRRGPKEPVFYGPVTGDRADRATVSHALGRALVRHGLPRMTAHRLRHGAASLMLAQGWPTKVIAEQLGNTERVVSATYAHLAPGVARRAVAALERRKG